MKVLELDKKVATPQVRTRGNSDMGDIQACLQGVPTDLATPLRW